MDNADLYEVTYADGTTETMRGWSLRMVADSASDPHHEPVKVERVPEEGTLAGRPDWLADIKARRRLIHGSTDLLHHVEIQLYELDRLISEIERLRAR